MSAKQWPSCGRAYCVRPARVVDSGGVGWCWNHRSETMHNFSTYDIDAFDPWWAHSTMADDRGEPWVDLAYGEWPEGYNVPDSARPGWGLRLRPDVES